MATYTQLGFYFDQRRCTGCKACQIACKDKHDLPVGVTWRRVAEYTGGTWRENPGEGTLTPDVFTYYTSISCNHCADPICVSSCPTTAMHRGDNGIVSVNPDVCIGCKYCAKACPYGAPQFDGEKGVMTKCDFCSDRIATGGTPACVEACPSRALAFGEVDKMRATYGDQAGIEPLPDAGITRPNLVITAHPRARASGDGGGELTNRDEL